MLTSLNYIGANGGMISPSGDVKKETPIFERKGMKIQRILSLFELFLTTSIHVEWSR